MVDFMESIHMKLRRYKDDLQYDNEEFIQKLNVTRKKLFNFLDQQIEYLNNIKKHYNDELNYLLEEHRKTCKDNHEQFLQLDSAIHRNEHNPTKISQLIDEFQQIFPMRPKVLNNISNFTFQDIDISNLIKRDDINENGFKENSPTLHPIVSNEHNDLSSDHIFIPIQKSTVDNTENTTIVPGSMGFSHHKQIAEQNNDQPVEPESRSVSTCSTITGPNSMINLLFKIPYIHSRTPHLICFNEEENYLLIHSLISHELQYLLLNSRQLFTINLPFNDQILNIGYSRKYQLFYLSTCDTNRFMLFRLNQKQQQIEIEQDIELIQQNERFISVHLYENLIYFLYISSDIVILGKYDLDQSTFSTSISFENKLYDEQEKCLYNIIDFTINTSYISFLVRLKNKSNKYMINVHDYDSLDKLHSFDLIDAIKPLSIISTEKKLQSATRTMNNDETESLLFVNDLRNHLIHCCNHQEYLIPVQVNGFGICPLNDGNLCLIANKDIRGLKVQDYLKRNQF